ncbi:MAG: thiamine phosphate synthase [Terracidiphilus sp.]
MAFSFPRVYPILDSSVIPSTDRSAYLLRLGTSLADAGVSLLEYRNKTGPVTEILADAGILRAAMPTGDVKLILDDRIDLVAITGFDGVHVDTGDASPAEARQQLGPDHLIGTFGGSQALIPGILSAPVSYLSIGPVFATTTKETTKAPIGPEGVRRLRAEAGPAPVLVAVGGITLATAQQVLAAGATTLAISAAIFRTADPAATFRLWRETLG